MSKLAVNGIAGFILVGISVLLGYFAFPSLDYLLKATRASAGGYVDTFEIRGIIEENKIQLQETIKNSLN